MSKLYDAIMGLAVGDAMGVPYEFCERDTFEATDMTGYGTHNQPPGTWSDDTSMALATINSFRLNGGIDLDDMMAAFVQWLYGARFTPYDQVFDVGATTRQAITAWFKLGKEVDECGLRSEQDNGNGSLMRILPLAFFPDVTREDVWAVSGLTHAHEISCIACEIYLDVARQLLAGKAASWAVFRSAIQYSHEKFTRLRDLGALSRDDIRSTGYVVDTLEAALWCLLKTDSYRDCVLTAVNLGEDTDTVAAVAGGLAGIIYGIGGERGVPLEWINQLARRDWIEKEVSACSSILK
jgi:ADP-ribosylglycohydrolase